MVAWAKRWEEGECWHWVLSTGPTAVGSKKRKEVWLRKGANDSEERHPASLLNFLADNHQFSATTKHLQQAFFALRLSGMGTALGAMPFELGIIILWCQRNLKKNLELNRSLFTRIIDLTSVTMISPWLGYRDQKSNVPGSAVMFCQPVCHSGEKSLREQPPTVT